MPSCRLRCPTLSLKSPPSALFIAALALHRLQRGKGINPAGAKIIVAALRPEILRTGGNEIDDGSRIQITIAFKQQSDDAADVGGREGGAGKKGVLAVFHRSQHIDAR